MSQPQLLEDEPVDIEAAIPAEENEPVEAFEEAEDSTLPGFDEGALSREDRLHCAAQAVDCLDSTTGCGGKRLSVSVTVWSKTCRKLA